MFFVNLDEVGDRDAHLVGAPDKFCLLEIELCGVALAALVKLDGLMDWVRNLSEHLLIHVEDELFLLEFDLVCLVHLS